MSGLFLFGVMVVSVTAEPMLKYNFNNFEDGPIDGQFEWNVYNKVKDSSALSIMNELGTSEVNGDKALVIKTPDVPIRCVTGEPIRWLPGKTLTMEFDYKIAVEAADLVNNKPVLTVMVGNSLLSEKSSFAVRLEATPAGDWLLDGNFPDKGSKKIYGENYLIRSNTDVSISDWFRFTLVVKKLSEPDCFDASIEIRHPQTNKILTAMRFTDDSKDKISKSMWNAARVHVGFMAPADQYGLVCIDNLKVSSSE